MLDTETIFDRYQEIRPRLPKIARTPNTKPIASLLDLCDEIDAFVFDAFGVLNVGERLIEGADRRLNALRARGCQIRVLTNAASYDRDGATAKFERLGISLGKSEIVTSREAALMHLPAGRLGVIAADEDMLRDVSQPHTRLGDTSATYDEVDAFLFFSTANWTDARQKLLRESMLRSPRPVIIANADLAAPRDNGFSLEPGHFGHLIEDDCPGCVRFFGKPYPEVYELVERTLPGVEPTRVAMCGDTLHTDILGATAFGWKSVLVTADGLFAGRDMADFCQRSGVRADWQLPRI